MATLDANVNPEQDQADLVTWLQAYDLQGLHPKLVEFGYDRLSVCTLLDETTLAEMGVQSRAHRETLLTAVNDLRQLDADVDEYDDGWSSQEEGDAPKPAPASTAAVSNGDSGAAASTMRFLSGLDSGKLEESYRQSFSEDSEMAGDFSSLPPPPPPAMLPPAPSGEPQYAEIPMMPPPGTSLPAPPPPPAGDDDIEEKTTSSFLASFGSSMSSFLSGGDSFDATDEGPPVPPKPRAAPRSPRTIKSVSEETNDVPPPVPTSARPTPPQDGGSKPPTAPRKAKPPPPQRDDTSMQGGSTPTASQASEQLGLYASVSKPSQPPPGVDLPPVVSAGPAPPPPAPKAKPAPKPKVTKGVSIVEPEKPLKSKASEGKLDPKDRRSMVDIQGGDVDLDALLADLMEMESGIGSAGTSPVKTSALSSSYNTISKPPPAPIDEDEFSKLMAEMDMMSMGTSAVPNRQSSDLAQEISKLSGGGKVLQSVPQENMSTSAIVASALGSSDNEFHSPSPDVEDDLEALSRDLGGTPTPKANSRLSGSFVSSMFKSDSGFGSTNDPASLPSSSLEPRSSSGDIHGELGVGRQLSSGDARRPSETPSVFGGEYSNVEVREVSNTAIVKLPDKPEERLNRELAQFNNGNSSNLSEADKEARLKAIKVQMAVEKLKEAKVKKIVLKAYNDDGSSKMIVIDDKMTAREVCSRLMKKNRVQPGPNFVLIEQLTEHYIERRLEDHDLVVPVLDSWPRDSNNSVAFTAKPDKYMLLKRPQLFMPPNHAYAPGQKTAVKESIKRDIILKELFVAQTLPEVEGFLTYKEGRKGNWKKQYFSLRKSGLYYSTKGKAAAMKDLHRMVELKDMDVYTGHAYRKKYKAHTEFCFTLKPNGPLDITERKMRHFCADTRQEQNAWIQGIRLAKLGNLLLEDYELTYKQMPWLSRETEEEIDGIVKLQEETRIDAPERSGTISKRLRKNTTKKPHDHAASDLAARSEMMVTSSGSSVGSRPVSSGSFGDEEDGGSAELTTWQKQFGQAWKSAPDPDDELLPSGRKISIDELPPTPKTTATPYTSEFAPGDEDGMYNVRLF